MTQGMKLWWQSASLAPRRSGFDSRRLHSRLRSVNGKHTPFVRPGCGFESCRRLYAPVAQWTELRPATAEVAGSSPAGRIASTRGRSSAGRASERHSEEARSIRAVRFTGPWCNGSTPSSNLDGPGSNPGGLADPQARRGPERLGYLLAEAVKACGSTPHIRSHTTTATTRSAAGRHGPVIDYESTGRGFESRPEHFALR
jgi:hypothetical protein